MTKLFEDHMGNMLHLSRTPRRIVSLVPSQTELLFDLGLDEEIIGITDYCIHPAEQCAVITKIGGPKSVDFDLIDRLGPDLIIANKEENDEAEIKKLQLKYPVWVSDIYTIDDALDMISGIGALVDRTAKADEIAARIAGSLAEFDEIPISVAYVIWKDPCMVAGRDTFIDEMINRCGLTNVFRALRRYPVVTEKKMWEARPDAILLCSEPYAFTDKHRSEFKEKFPFARVLVVDGEIFSWYGSRLQYAGAYFTSLRQELTLNRKEDS